MKLPQYPKFRGSEAPDCITAKHAGMRNLVVFCKSPVEIQTDFHSTKRTPINFLKKYSDYELE
jgi:hypothetical protein